MRFKKYAKNMEQKLMKKHMSSNWE